VEYIMPENISEIPRETIDGDPITLGSYKGSVLLIVNVASKCGLTPQYEGLQKLYSEKRDEGLEILAFPANDFHGQEPGSEAEIKEFCSSTYNTSFPMFAKISVIGPTKHRLYQRLTAAQPEAEGGETMRDNLRGYGIEPNSTPEVLWNFEKFLVDRDGRVAARFAPDITADDPRLRTAVDQALTRGL
jgi:glutathione peroxidase